MQNKNNIKCGITFTDKKRVEYVKKHLPVDNIISSLSEHFKILGDFNRLKILFALSKKELCVCDISSLIGVSVSTISHQLRLLKYSRLVKFRKDKKMVYYTLYDQHVNKIINEALKHQRRELMLYKIY